MIALIVKHLTYLSMNVSTNSTILPVPVGTATLENIRYQWQPSVS